MKMRVCSGALIIGYSSFLICLTHLPLRGRVNADNSAENGPESNEDTTQFHDKMSHERRHLLAHLADRMDLDGEGLRHIQKHLGEQTLDAEENKDLKDVADGDNAKGIFYFFKFHDYDDNQKLDGLEWMQALTDFHQEDDNSKGEYKEGGKVFLEHEAEAIVDELLSKHDKNDDGMIDFFELMNSKVDSIMTELDKPAPGENEEHHTDEQQQQNTEHQSSLEQEFNQLQQNQHQEQSQEQQDTQPDNQQPQEDQQTQDNQQEKDNDQQETNNEEIKSDEVEQEVNEEQNEPSSLEEEYNKQQENQKQNEPSSLEEEYDQQQQQS